MEIMYENSRTTNLFIVSVNAQSFISDFYCVKTVHIKAKIVRSVHVPEQFWSLSLMKFSFGKSESDVQRCVHTTRKWNNPALYEIYFPVFS